ncbi:MULTISPECIES: YitT family protein [unclassified Lysinibacillus]|uniref:YitT family protein n=1 Tax=unclassified Lysinibacillus TaxID=2636778 RepID=UPI002011A07A|nr:MULTISPECIES: YitT family protein [unclassified Lysinibacillus]MCL1698038.1 YitT family protein [Lysinibacillus sp. BPa_S21]MCL1703026.1 YitT family protein [Lysinibacillus sp. Bpr_S20]
MYFFTKGLVIVIGSAAVSLGINLFLTPYQILDGGVVGIALILHYIYKLKIGLMIIIISIPIFVISWYKYRAYFYNSIHGLIASSLSIDLLKPVRNLIQVDAIYSAIFGGVLMGFGVGLMLRFQTSTGGTDLIAQFLSDKTGINVGILIFVIDSIVIVIGGLLLSSNTLLLSIITILVVGITTSIMTSRV